AGSYALHTDARPRHTWRGIPALPRATLRDGGAQHAPPRPPVDTRALSAGAVRPGTGQVRWTAGRSPWARQAVVLVMGRAGKGVEKTPQGVEKTPQGVEKTLRGPGPAPPSPPGWP